jgi:hypothetical protein
MTKLDHLFRDSLSLAKQIERNNEIDIRKWRKLKKALKRYRQLESIREAKLYAENSIEQNYNILDVVYALEYYSDRWTRGRMYTLDAMIKEVMENTNV